MSMISQDGHEFWNLIPLLLCGIFALALIIRKLLLWKGSEEIDHKDEVPLPGTPVRSCIGIFDLLPEGYGPPKPVRVRSFKSRVKHETPQESDEENIRDDLERVD